MISTRPPTPRRTTRIGALRCVRRAEPANTRTASTVTVRANAVADYRRRLVGQGRSIMAEPCPKHCDHIVGHIETPHGPFMPAAVKPPAESAFQCCHCGRYNSYGRDLRAEEI